jgi:hypothetical protein
MKTYNSWTIIDSLIYQVKILGLLLLMTGLVRCECGPSPHSDPRSSKLPPPPDKPLDNHPDTQDNIPDTQGNKQTAITQNMLDQVEASSLDSDDKERLKQVLELFQHPRPNEIPKKVESNDYKWALCSALDLEDEAIIQAMVARKDQVEGDIDWKGIIQYTFRENKEVGLQALLKAGVKANRDVLKDAINSRAEVNIIKILLNPELNPLAPKLIDQGLLEYTLDQALHYEDPDGKSQAVLLALLDPAINHQLNTLKINKGMLQDAAVWYPNKDILQKLLESIPTISLTNEEIKDLIETFASYKNKEEILKIFLKGLIKQKGLSDIKKILEEQDSKGVSTIDMVNFAKPEYKDIFTELGLF